MLLLSVVAATRLSESVTRYCWCRRNETKLTPAQLGLAHVDSACNVVRVPERPQLTIVVLSYLPSQHSRLNKIVCGYLNYSVVAKVLIVWNGPSSEPPDACGEVILEHQNSLVNRYRHSDLIPTSVVLLQDDDLAHSQRDLEAFASAHSFLPKAILGLNSVRDFKKFEYVTHPRGRAYSLLLGRTSVLQTHFLTDFLQRTPPPILHFIHHNRPTCEDIALHFFVANTTNLPPVALWDVKPQPLADEDKHLQMHTSLPARDWRKRRSSCLRHFADEYHRFPLVRTRCRFRGRH